MPRIRVLTSVLHNVLGTFASRYSDHRGYWLLGQLPADLDRWVVDLMADPPEGESTIDVARRLAVRRFKEQLGKSGFDASVVREAELAWTRQEPAFGWQGEYRAQGRRVELRMRVVTDKARIVERRRSVFVAVHDPGKESRRLPIDWGA